MKYNSAITKIEVGRDAVQLSSKKDPNLPPFDDVVLAIPPSTWSKIPHWAPQELRDFVAEPPQMGKNIKGLVAFDTRFWKEQHLGPSATLNTTVDQTWETTENHPKPQFGLVAFSGAQHAESLSALDEPTAHTEIVGGLEQVYKNTAKKVRNFKFMNWPKEKWALASYSFPRSGDIMRRGP